MLKLKSASYLLQTKNKKLKSRNTAKKIKQQKTKN